MRTTALALFVVCLAAMGAAHAAHGDDIAEPLANASADDILDHPGALTSAYNANADKLPSLVRSLVSGERINVHVDRSGNDTVIGLVMDGARIDRVEEGGVGDPTVSFHTDAATIETILAAENPRKQAVSAFNGDGITYRTHGLGSTIKFGVISTVSTVLGALL